MDLEQPFHGIRSPRVGPATIATLIAAYSERMSTAQFFSHVTAAHLHGLPLPRRFASSGVIHVCVDDPAERQRVRGTVAHHARPGTVRLVDIGGYRVAAPVDVWRQLAAVLSLDELIVMGDALVGGKRPLATMAELRTGVARHAGKRGARRLREALEWVRPGVLSPRETEIRLLLVRAGLPEPEVNAPLTDRTGRKIATGDLVYREYRVLVEYDGEQHRTDEEQYHWDIDRLDAIMEADWRVVRLNKTHIRLKSASAVRKVDTALRDRGWRP
ncbi:hypothetical protein E3O44_05140 [Cryobacterium algoricola]|uniref:DUF559 domain-containing protein n=1 Tax=Cryobacterium algoricola TaxID=1259183 RepID=A0ABY2IHJ6_9MICO|nr:hypothetical protein [Cryobacterium algoricola]TFB89010.1 hypothetical protein E3O44_05140 [Cryobacterium algoricola]